MSLPLLSIIIPTFNEANTIVQLVDEVCAVAYPVDIEVVLVDDGSIDRTYEKQILLKQRKQDFSIRIFKNRINKGKGFSIRKGIRRAKGDIIIIQDADKEYDPREIPMLLAPVIEGKADAVFGSRFLRNPRPEGMATPNFYANRILTAATNLLFGSRLTDMETCYKVFRASIVKGLPLKSNRFSFEPEVTALLLKRKVKIQELPISYHGRTAKEGKKIKTRDFFYAIATLLWQRSTP